MHYDEEARMIHSDEEGKCHGVVTWIKSGSGEGANVCDCGKQWDENWVELPRPLPAPIVTYRQCNDSACPAYMLDLPHSHIEESSETERLARERMSKLEDFKARWDFAQGQPGPITILPTLEKAPLHQWLSIPVDEPDWLMRQVGEYITWVETGMTKDVCKCTWITHPEKGNIRGGDTALDCPAHSKEGLVLGFFAWLTAQPAGLLPDTAMGAEHGD
jgi:hypothetical protein